MTAIAWSRPDAAEEGVVPFDARRHLRQVAELISSVFADELDASGRGALQEMQLVSRLSPVLGGLLSTAFFNEFVLGYVWVEEERVIGNVTFQRTEMSGTRWRISNVAVAPGYRQRGIATALMRAALREIAQRGGSWAILQVRIDNPAARHLYTALGFTDVCQDGVWQRPPLPIHPARRSAGAPGQAAASGDNGRRAPRLEPLQAGHWRNRLELARAARSGLAYWAEPIDTPDYQPNLGRLVAETLGNMTGVQRVRRWGAWQDGRLMGAVEAVAPLSADHYRLHFDVRPEARGQLEWALVEQGLQALAPAPLRPIVVEHSGDDSAGVAVLQQHDFRTQRILLTMRRLMAPAEH